MRLRDKNGQSTLEYLIIVAVIIVAIIFVATGTFKTQLTSLLERVSRKPAAMLDSENMLPSPELANTTP
jgi:Flp pilus assembly pilin Flp